MLHLLIIALFIANALHDSVAGGGRFGAAVAAAPAPAWVWAASLGPMLALTVATLVVIGALAKQVEQRGSERALMLADRLLDVTRCSAVLLHACNVLAIGWLGAIRGLTGDLIAVDELLSVVPALLVFVAGWWAYYPIEERLRASTTFRLLETGHAQYPPVSRGRFVLLNIRHQILLTLVPLSMIAAWGEGVERGLVRVSHYGAETGLLGQVGSWLSSEANRGTAQTVLQLLGVAGVFILSPLVLRSVWDTVRLESGPMHDRLMALCTSSGVKIKDLLVWRTHGTMLNGAVIGLVAPLRYILLTDALLDQLPERQVEAVMAHEVGHAKHAHMPWLAASMLAGFTSAAVIVSVAAWGLLNLLDFAGQTKLADSIGSSYGLTGLMALSAFAGGVTWFGFVSRRFEWQADAFAVQELSRAIEVELAKNTLTVQPASPLVLSEFANIVTTIDLGSVSQVSTISSPAVPHNTVRPEAVEAMTGALDSVADLNYISKTRFTWRHGSIAHRQKRLRALAGRPLGAQRIDRTVRWMKRGVLLGIVLLIGAIALDRTEVGNAPASPPSEETSEEGAHR